MADTDVGYGGANTFQLPTNSGVAPNSPNSFGGIPQDVLPGLLASTPLAPLAPLLGQLFATGTPSGGQGGQNAPFTNNQSISDPNSPFSININSNGGPGGAGGGGSGGFFGLGGAGGKGGAGGGSDVVVNQDLSFAQNLPTPLATPNAPNILQGNVSSSFAPSATPSALNQMNQNPQAMGQLYNAMATPSQAAGGYLPAIMQAGASQPQSANGQPQNIIPGSSSPLNQGSGQQAGGYLQQRPPLQGGVSQNAPFMGNMAPPLNPQGRLTPFQLPPNTAIASAANPGIVNDTLSNDQDPSWMKPGAPGTPNAAPLQKEIPQAAAMPQAAPSFKLGGKEATTPSHPIDSQLQEYSDNIRKNQQQIAPVLSNASKGFYDGAQAVIDKHQKVDSIISPALETGETELQAAQDRSNLLSTSAGREPLSQDVLKTTLKDKTPFEQGAYWRFANGLSGVAPARPKWRTALNVLSEIGRGGQSGFGNSSAVYMERQNDQSIANKKTAQQTANYNRDKAIYDDINKQVKDTISSMEEAANRNLTAITAKVTNLRDQQNQNNAELHKGISTAYDLTMRPAMDALKGLVDSSTLENNQAKIYESDTSAKSAEEGHRIGWANVAHGVEAQGLQKAKYEAGQNKSAADLQHVQEENKALQAKIDADQWTGKYAQYKPGPNVKLHDYDDQIRNAYQSGQIDNATVLELHRKAALILKRF